ncbi:hypothetical protein [Bradyrhizobium arachidis]|uniref:hypothetical protein n=1 Tax=Bradyrhizobium arachidis TaxID=858423 RepID=UPI0004148BD9|nr:hypothetical protein [Bradyrhizobium arachidis]UFW45384.1 hypothetical protein BaraCB756_23945 [Bradyrhizobium arachidis]
MNDEAKEAGLAALISRILGGKRADEQASAAIRSLRLVAAPPAPATPPTLQGEPATAAAPPEKPVVPLSAGGPMKNERDCPRWRSPISSFGELRKMDAFRDPDSRSPSTKVDLGMS